jgi:hypothetical protein
MLMTQAKQLAHKRVQQYGGEWHVIKHGKRLEVVSSTIFRIRPHVQSLYKTGNKYK